MLKNNKVSIIVPVYNVEQFLERCILSLLNQTHKNVEVILVDDKSSDNSRSVIEKFAATDERVIPVFQQVNSGVSAARNEGIKKATGDWIGFCDGDDWFDENLIEELLENAYKDGADYVFCNYKIVSASSSMASSSLTITPSCCDNKTVVACGPTSSCTHLIKKELFDKAKVSYPVGLRQYEELPVIPVLSKYADKICVVDKPLYNYFQRGDGSSASNKAIDSEKNFFRAFGEMKELLGDDYREEAEYHAIYALFYGEILNLCKRKALRREIVAKIKEYEELFPTYTQNKYLVYMGRVKNIFIKLVKYRFVSGLKILAFIHSKIVN